MADPSSPSKEPRRQRVLRDHKRLGRRFIPPMASLDWLSALPWRTVLPEIVWIGLLHNRLGDARAAEVVVEIVRAADRLPLAHGEGRPIHGGIAATWFGGLSAEDHETVLDGLSDSVKADIRQALGPLVTLYPSCPVAFLAAGGIPADAPTETGC